MDLSVIHTVVKFELDVVIDHLHVGKRALVVNTMLVIDLSFDNLSDTLNPFRIAVLTERLTFVSESVKFGIAVLIEIMQEITNLFAGLLSVGYMVLLSDILYQTADSFDRQIKREAGKIADSQFGLTPQTL